MTHLPEGVILRVGDVQGVGMGAVGKPLRPGKCSFLVAPVLQQRTRPTDVIDKFSRQGGDHHSANVRLEIFAYKEAVRKVLFEAEVTTQSAN
jgi:hypothetical protein